MILTSDDPGLDPTRAPIDALYRADEGACLAALLDDLDSGSYREDAVQDAARRLVEAVRARSKGGLDAFLHEYGLSTREGVLLMCVAEALLRIPDDQTQEALIRDKLSAADWDRHLGRSDSVFVNASTWALMLTGRVVGMHGVRGQSAGAGFRRVVSRLGEPVIREAVNQAMRILGRQFVMGRNIEVALDRARSLEAKGYSHSYDMLGEAARTMADSDRFFESYRAAIDAIGKASAGAGHVDGPSISVKLSALHPRYELAQSGRIMDELVPRLAALARRAAEHGIGLTIDAEEAARLDLSLDVVDALSGDPSLAGWEGFGVVVQTYLKRAPAVIDWLAEMATRHRRRLMVRLVKGAYWDAEVKLAQELALTGYPVFTRKVNTDVCYLACAKKLIASGDVFYPQFATHNAHTIAAILDLAGNRRDFEFQRLHGMGEELYEEIVEKGDTGVACRIYGPVGNHEDLLAYLVRRLLENGANSSFVNRIQDEALPVEEIIADPIARARAQPVASHPRIPQPRDLYGAERVNFRGLDITDRRELARLAEAMDAAAAAPWHAAPIVAGAESDGEARAVHSPADRARVVGEVVDAGAPQVERALQSATRGAAAWNATPIAARAAALRRLADLYEAHCATLMAIAVREAGKTLGDALAEVREAVDFCRYYALEAERRFGVPEHLRVAAGEPRTVHLEGGAVFCCISPWNFPLAIFTGQIAAALAAGNAVIAKPAEQTPLIAAAAVRLMLEAGVLPEAIALLPGDGETVGAALVADPRVEGVCFTGSTEVARIISRTLAGRDGPLAPLIAETGGMNAMIVDSSALPEQVAHDVVMSAFQSAGQRCSALRVLFVQDDVADRMLGMIAGAMDELQVDDPAYLSTDVGPVIDADAKAVLEAHIRRMRGEAKLLKQVRPGPNTGDGTFVAPVAFEIDSLASLEREVFGPVLHVIRYPVDGLDEVIDAINATGYGLTHGIHTRVDDTRDYILERIRAGNAYVNRNQIGAVVGVQPFGGEGLSGTGPKAGGPHYVPRFAREVAAPGGEPVGAAQPGTAGFSAPDLSAALDRAPSGGIVFGVDARAMRLERAADSLDSRARRARADATVAGDLTLAAEYLRFHAAQAHMDLGAPEDLPGPTGEQNQLRHVPRGVVCCVETVPGRAAPMAAQMGAALAAGNAVVAWHQDPVVAAALVDIFRSAGFSEDAVSSLGAGDAGWEALVGDPRVHAFAYAGPAKPARDLQRALAAVDGPIRALIPYASVCQDHAPVGNPLAGSPGYLYRFCLERAVSIDTTASGGNASLFALE